MLSSTNLKTPIFSSFSNQNPSLSSFNLPFSPPKALPKSNSASFIPPNPPPQQQLYQPFRPPPSPLPPKFRTLDPQERLDVLTNRLGLWFEYAPLISSLYQEGFAPPSIEEITGVSGIEQNRLIVASKVRDSLVESKTDENLLYFFDTGGAELLYEIRLLSGSQRAESVRYIVENRFDAKSAGDLARAMKDFPRRKMDKGWKIFEYRLPGDCLSFMYYRQSREHSNIDQKVAALKQALHVAESESAKGLILGELEGGEGEKEEEDDELVPVRVPVVRLQYGEVAEATRVVVLPVCKADEDFKEISEAPLECRSGGDFGVVEAEKGWKRWVVLPSWEPLSGLSSGGVVVSFGDARALPWKTNRWYKEEGILVVMDRKRKEVEADDSFYLAAAADGGVLKVDRGSAWKEMGVKECLGTVVLVVRPPREDTDDQLADEDWD